MNPNLSLMLVFLAILAWPVARWLEERRRRWQSLIQAARKHSVDNWSESFLERLAPLSTSDGSATRDILYLASVA